MDFELAFFDFLREHLIICATRIACETYYAWSIMAVIIVDETE